jgi:hypothetical protein
MKTKSPKQLKREIMAVKRKIARIGNMRPGSLTRQYKSPKDKKGAYYQLSYTRKMKSKTDYIPARLVKATKRQIAVYKYFKNLVDKWIDLAIDYAKLKMIDPH